MKSQIKMEISRYPVFDLASLHDLPHKEELIRKCAIASEEASRKTKIQNLFHNKKDQVGYFLNCDPSEVYNIKPKKNLNRVVSELTNQLEHPKERKDLSQSKFKMLKKIIEHYDIKNLKRSDYSKLINTFGLNIETARTTEKKNQTLSKNQNFNIKSTKSSSSRFSTLKKCPQNDSTVVLLHLSEEVKPTPRQPSNSAQSSLGIKQKLTSLQKQQCSSKKKDKQEKVSKIETKLQVKKITPFKYQSKQDIIKGKVNKYRELLFALNLSNRMYRDMEIRQYPKPLKFYVGAGNNSNLVKSLMKKRFWYEETSKIKQAQFVWTQIKVQGIFEAQQNCEDCFIEKQQEKIRTRTSKTLLNCQNSLEENMEKVLTINDYRNYLKINESVHRRTKIEFSEKIKYSAKKPNLSEIMESDRVHNHLSSNGLLGNKKGMFYSLRQYYKLKQQDVFEIVPMTFHITKGVLDEEYKKFLAFYEERKIKKLANNWIIKPGQFSNRGQGISCSNKFEDIKKRVLTCRNGNEKKGDKKTLILQQYITNPLLYHHRKFDIRVFMLVTVHNGKIKAYWYQEGYIRTSSYTFNLSEITDTDIHLTNDAIQKQSGRYGKYEPANKLSFHEFQRYLDGLSGKSFDLQNSLVPRMKEIATESIKSSFLFLDRERKKNNFELFGLDFMVDNTFRPWLIEINTNPCLQLSCPILRRIIPHMLQNALRIGLDPIFPPADSVPHNYKYTIAENASIYNRFELIFDEQRDGQPIRQLFNSTTQSQSFMLSLMGIQEDQQQYEEEGELDDYDI